MDFDTWSTPALSALLVVLVAALIGWCMNVYKIIGLGIDNIGEIVVRVIGVFLPPLGALLGFF
jgi:hypothetical protein